MNKNEEAKVLTEEVVEALSLKEGDLSNEEFVKTIKKNKSAIKKWVDLSVKYKNDTFKKCAEVWDGTVKGFFKDFVKNNKNKLKKAIITGTAVASIVCLSACSGKESMDGNVPNTPENPGSSQIGDGVYDKEQDKFVFGGDGKWDGTIGDNNTISGTSPDYTFPDFTYPDGTTSGNPTTPGNPTAGDWSGGYEFGGDAGNSNGDGTYVEGTNPTNPTDPTNPTNPAKPTNPTDPTNPTNPSTPVVYSNYLEDLVSQFAGRNVDVMSVSVLLDDNGDVLVRDSEYRGVKGHFVTLLCSVRDKGSKGPATIYKLLVEQNDFYFANGGKDPGTVTGSDQIKMVYDRMAKEALDRYGIASYIDTGMTM